MVFLVNSSSFNGAPDGAPRGSEWISEFSLTGWLHDDVKRNLKWAMEYYILVTLRSALRVISTSNRG